MTTSSTAAAMHVALATYIQTSLQAVAGLASSICLKHWPEPAEDLALTDTKVVVGLIRAGAAKSGKRIGGPTISRITPGVSPAATYRFNYDVEEQPFTLGVWAISQSLRDDVDQTLHGILNKPFWSTVLPTVNTTSPVNISPGVQIVTPVNMDNVWPETYLSVDALGSPEIVRVLSTTPTTFTAKFRFAHVAGVGGVTLLEVAARREYGGIGLSLRCPLHFGAIARFDFEPPAALDDAEFGKGSQRQEWRSIRQGVGALRQLIERTGSLQTDLNLSTQIAIVDPVSDTVPTPIIIDVF